MNTVAPAIKRRRLQMGLSQKDMSDKLYVSEKTYRNIENGITRPDMERLEQIAEALEIGVIDLINSAESVAVNQENNNANTDNKDQSSNQQQQFGYTNEVNIRSNSEFALIEKLLADKDQQLQRALSELDELKVQMKELIAKLVK